MNPTIVHLIAEILDQVGVVISEMNTDLDKVEDSEFGTYSVVRRREEVNNLLGRIALLQQVTGRHVDK